MTWSTIGIIWLLSGIVSAIWHTLTGNHMYETLEYNSISTIFHMIIVAVLALIAGPIGLIIKFYEDFIDTV
jgi:hypothetical protein